MLSIEVYRTHFLSNHWAVILFIKKHNYRAMWIIFTTIHVISVNHSHYVESKGKRLSSHDCWFVICKYCDTNRWSVIFTCIYIDNVDTLITWEMNTHQWLMKYFKLTCEHPYIKASSQWAYGTVCIEMLTA